MLALLHTSVVHVPVFDALRDAAHPGLELRHHVAAELLDVARRDGPSAVTGAVREAVLRAVGEGARAVLCTCPTIGQVAEAVAAGSRVVVLAALRSTLAPTAALVEDEARRAGRAVGVRSRLVDGAWERFETGDTEGYLRLVADAADAVTDADVIVLAQASMAPAGERTGAAVPVLASPGPGLAAAAAAVSTGRRVSTGRNE
ncbi:arylsulfatase [Streptomyces sp. DH1]|uniref:arylsulfatase n=1 Tax=Streptomyces sp. DH1 TaxID=2857012 RepID=UPI001E54892D|nr:arylsulfatase [Streptomyces sp. DH1]